jgi:hypothetical protein
VSREMEDCARVADWDGYGGKVVSLSGFARRALHPYCCAAGARGSGGMLGLLNPRAFQARVEKT